MASKRRLARIAVLQTLFEEDFREGKIAEALPEALRRNIKEATEPVDAAFAEKLLTSIHEHKEHLQQAIREHAPEWPLERMDRMTRAILLIGAEELLFGGDAPPAVIMNEAIDIAKTFGGEESGKFVNGVLNAIAHE